MHLVLVLPLGLYLPIHLYISAILICRLVDLSTCRPSAIVNNKHLYMSFICTAKIKLSTCRPVDLSTCRPVELVLLSTTKIRLGLGLVCGSVYGWARVSRPVDLSTCLPVDLVLLSTTKIRLGLGLGLVCG